MTSDFDAFLRNLTPTAIERRELILAAGRVADLFRHRFSSRTSRSGHGERLCFPIGSHDRNTAITPVRTLDMMVVVPEQFRGADGARAADVSAVPSAFFDTTIALLAGRFSAVRICRQGWFGISVEATSRRVDVRLLPCVPAEDGGYRVAHCKTDQAGGGRRHVHPQAERRALRTVDAAAGGKATELVRVLKAWRRASAAPLSSVALERLACAYLSAWIRQRQGGPFYDRMVQDFFYWLTFQADRKLPMPGIERRLPIGNAWLAHAESACVTAAEAAALGRSGRRTEALARWRALFGLAFGGEVRPPLLPPLTPVPPVDRCRLVPWQALSAP